MVSTKRLDVYVVICDKFGDAVARQLKMAIPNLIECQTDDPRVVAPGEGTFIVVANRLITRVCDAIDTGYGRERRRLVPVMVDGRVLRVGPTIVGSEGSACWDSSSSPDSAAWRVPRSH